METSSDPKAALPQIMGTAPDASSLGNQLESLSMSGKSTNSSPPGTIYQVFILAGFGHK